MGNLSVCSVFVGTGAGEHFRLPKATWGSDDASNSLPVPRGRPPSYPKGLGRAKQKAPLNWAQSLPTPSAQPANNPPTPQHLGPLPGIIWAGVWMGLLNKKDAEQKVP